MSELKHSPKRCSKATEALTENKLMKADLSLWSRAVRDGWETGGRRQRASRLSDSFVETRETGDGISFPNKGVSAQQVTAMPGRTIYNHTRTLLPNIPPCSCIGGFFLSDQGTIKKKRGKGGGSVTKQKEEESLICLHVNKKVLVAKT